MQDFNELHSYLTTTNEFFKKMNKPKIDMFKIYKALYLERFEKDEEICKFGEQGDTFYMILKGEVGIRVPINHKENFDD